MNLTLKFEGEMNMEIDIDELLHRDLLSVVEEYIQDNMRLLMNIVEVGE